MQTPDQSRPVLFVNTGVQVISFPLGKDVNLTAEQVGKGWQHCRCRSVDATGKEVDLALGYVQWQVLRDRFLLAIDTALDDEQGEPLYCAKSTSLGDDEVRRLSGLLDARGQPFAKLPTLEFLLRPSHSRMGEPRAVHLVVDFGNSRTGGLLVEFRSDEPLMTPLRLENRLLLDAWERLRPGDPACWFSSKSHWSTTPYLPAVEVATTVYEEIRRGGLLGGRPKPEAKTVRTVPRTFEEYSQVRMGREADDLAGVVHVAGDVRTGVSSPKRYLWASDSDWLEGANWHMADPYGRYDVAQHATTLKGPLLGFIPEDDQVAWPTSRFPQAPATPRHAPRALMTAALYEVLCQAFTFANSPAYQHLTGDQGRVRVLQSLTLTYPSGMITAERERLRAQAEKAIAIFMQTVGRGQPRHPDLRAAFNPAVAGAADVSTPPDLLPQLKLSIDEASAVHLTYLWSESRKLGGKVGLWFHVMGRRPSPDASSDPQSATTSAELPADGTGCPVGGAPSPRPDLLRPVTRPGAARPAPSGRRGAAPAAAPTGPEVRIACIDIGGGTSDLMIASYRCRSDAGSDVILGETLHRDGVSIAGDQLVKRLLEQIIVPQFAQVVGLEPYDLQTLFGREVPANIRFRRERTHWMSRMWVPLAQAYIEAAVSEVDTRLSHTDPELVAPDVVDSLQEVINRLWGPGTYQVHQDLGLWYGHTVFEQVVDEVFGDLLLDFSESVVEHRADVVLLAGLPTKIPYIRQLVETYLPLSRARIVPMYGRYAGAWYPFQNPDNVNPGVIVDPKSTVAVGAALEFCARHGKLPHFRFEMRDLAAKDSFYWGFMTESRIDHNRLLFERADPRGPMVPGTPERTDLPISAEHLIVGRKRRRRDDAQASPVYELVVRRGSRLGEIDLHVTFERRRDANDEEEIVVERVEGTVDGEPAVLGQNVRFTWRTLADERYYLDTGGLDKIGI